MEARGPPNNDLDKAKILYSKTVELEKQLRNELKKKSPLDRSVALLRNNIRDNFEQVLFLNYEYAVTKDVEQAIWKSVFYRVIEEFRKRLRKSAPSSSSNPSPQQQQQQEEEQKRLGSSFKQFLTSALNFYQRLLCKLQATFHLTLDGSVSYRITDDGLVKLHRSYLSCHRCFIFMGDLARYHKDIKFSDDDKTAPPVWTRAAQYYQRALLILPDNGNPHNQLAVLATYEDDSFSGVYRYFRSLAIRQPFVTARDNLKVLFEKNKLKLDGGDTPTNKPEENELDQFLGRFVKLQGNFFTKTELDTVHALKSDLLRSFSEFLVRANSPNPTILDSATILKMIAMLIFTVHNAVLPREGVVIMPKSPSKDAEDAAQLQALATSIAFEFVAVLVRATALFAQQHHIQQQLAQQHHIQQQLAQQHQPHQLPQQIQHQQQQGNNNNSNNNNNKNASASLLQQRFADHFGCASVFLEWVRVHPEYIPRCAPQSQAGLWDAVAYLLNSTCKIPESPKSGTPPVLEAEAELRGFLPLHNYMKTLPQSSLVWDPTTNSTPTPGSTSPSPSPSPSASPNSVVDSNVTNKEKRATDAWNLIQFRVRRLREFGSFVCGLQPQVMFHNKDTGLFSTLGYKPNSLSAPLLQVNPTPTPTPAPQALAAVPVNDNASVEDDSEDDDEDMTAFTATKFEFVEEDDEEEARMNQIEDDNLDDEVILFRPEQANFHAHSSNYNGLANSGNLSPPSAPTSPAMTHPTTPIVPTPQARETSPNGVQTKGAEFGIIGSRAKSPPHEGNRTPSPESNNIKSDAVSPVAATTNGTTEHTFSSPSTRPITSSTATATTAPANQYYSNFNFSSYYGFNHPFADGLTPTTSSAPVASLFGDAVQPSPSSSSAAQGYSLFSSDSPSIPNIIDMPFQQPPSPRTAQPNPIQTQTQANPPMQPPFSLPLLSPQMIQVPTTPTSHAPTTPNQQQGQGQANLDSDSHSPTCTNRDSPFAWLTPVPLALSSGTFPAQSPRGYSPNNAAISVTATPFLDSPILSSGVNLPFPFPGEPTLKFRTKNPFVNT